MHNERPTLETQIFNPQTPLEMEIVSLGPWFHNLHLDNNVQTAPNHPLGDFPKFKWEKISNSLPADLKGWRVLDIGCNAGFYTFELAKRGADVLGIDIDDHYLKQANWAAEKVKMSGTVEFRKMQVYEIFKLQGQFDLILFMGVFYHLRYPLLALDIIAQKVNKLLLFQTMTMPGLDVIDVPEHMEILEREIMLEPGFPKVAFIEKSVSGDFTNWWAPNHAAVEAILRSSGLKVESLPAHEIYLCSRLPDPLKIDIVINEMHAALGVFNNNISTGDNGKSDKNME
jgi:tRNA (mo5U34)-methyltransferase